MDKTYFLVSRKYKSDDTVVKIGGVSVGGGFTVIAGPCSVESKDQIISTASAVKNAGADILRGGVFKPRSSPYDFQGPGKIGFEWLSDAKKASGLPVVSEITDPSEIELFSDVDAFQVGARNMWNFELLKALGKTDKPVLLKRGPASRLDELLCAAEYIACGGNITFGVFPEQIGLKCCIAERIRTVQAAVTDIGCPDTEIVRHRARHYAIV